MSTKILVSYKRTDVTYAGEQRVDGEVIDLFENVTFAQQIRILHLLLQKHPDAEVELQRTDRAGLMPVYLEPDMVQLIREDPAKYIQAHTIPHRIVDLRKKNERTSKLAEKHVVPAAAIRAGHDTLKDAFGDVVYLNFRENRIEDPATGRWRATREVEADLGLAVVDTIVVGATGPHGARAGWVTVRINDLLANNSLSGFYLPRAWNEGGPWISRAALIEKYNKYLEEKSCLETTKAF